MFRRLRPLALALFAALLVGALSAPGAGAEGHYVCESAPCIATGESEEQGEIKMSGLTVKCSGTGEGTSGTKQGTSGIALVAPKSCTNSTTVRMNHCQFLGTNSTKEGLAPVELQCASESKVEVEVPGVCTLSFGPQKPSGGVHYTNVSGQVTGEGTATEVVFTKGPPGSLCGLISGKATITGKGLTKCYKDVGNALSGTEATTPTGLTKEGELTPCSVAE
jgi:hypothetical protein